MRLVPIALFLTFGAVPAQDQLEARVLATIHEHCGSCHDSALSTAKPAALKVFDLQESDWTARMSDDQLEKVVGRIKGKPVSASQLRQVERLMKKKLHERVVRAPSPPTQ